MKYTVPSDYDPHMTVRETQEAIKFIRDLFQKEFGKEKQFLDGIRVRNGNLEVSLSKKEQLNGSEL